MAAAGAILVYDITNSDSFENLTHWLTEAKTNGNPNMSLILVGNKCDLEDERVVGKDQVEPYSLVTLNCTSYRVTIWRANLTVHSWRQVLKLRD